MLKNLNRIARLERGTDEVDIAAALFAARSGAPRTPTAEVERLAASDRRYGTILAPRRRAGIDD